MSDLRKKAIHEAAHAVTGVLLGSPPDVVTIEANPDDGSAGHAVLDHGSPYDDLGGEDWNKMVRAITDYAGHMATLRLGYDEDFEEAGAADDYREAAMVLSSFAGPNEAEIQRHMDFAMQAASMIVELAWDQIDNLADLLEHETTVAGEQVTEWLQPMDDPETYMTLRARYPWIKDL